MTHRREQAACNSHSQHGLSMQVQATCIDTAGLHSCYLILQGIGAAALASRIKYIVDTSEIIWGSLDAGDVLGASLRFLRASAVHRLLLQAAGPAVSTRFPLVSHQWPAIEKFK